MSPFWKITRPQNQWFSMHLGSPGTLSLLLGLGFKINALRMAKVRSQSSKLCDLKVNAPVLPKYIDFQPCCVQKTFSASIIDWWTLQVHRFSCASLSRCIDFPRKFRASASIFLESCGQVHRFSSKVPGKCIDFLWRFRACASISPQIPGNYMFPEKLGHWI